MLRLPSLQPPSRPNLIRAGAALGAVVVIVVVVLLVTGPSATKTAPPARRTPLISIFEAPQQLASAPAPTLDLLRSLGVQYVRLFVRWSSLAPSPTASSPPAGFDGSSPGAYPAAGWSTYDAAIRDAQARGMHVMLDVGGPAPRWATGAGAPAGPTGVWKPSAAQFGQFVHAVTARYSGQYNPAGASTPLPRVSFWSIWNEPNLGVNLAPESIDGSTVDTSPAMYRGIVDAAWSALHATGHGHDTILIGELAPYGDAFGGNVPGNFGYMVPLRFVRGLYCVDNSLHPLQGSAAAARGCPTTSAGSKAFAGDHPALFQATGYAVHPYPQGPQPPGAVVTASSDYAYLAVLPRLESLLDALTSSYGSSARFPLYATEYGYFTNPPFQAGAPLTVAAAYLNQAEYISWRNPTLRSWDQYLLVDPPSGGPSHFDSGLEFENGVHKPSYDAYRMPIYLPSTHQSSGQSLEVWGCVRPAYYAAQDTKRQQQVRIELQPSGGGEFKVLRTLPIPDSSCYFDTRVRFPSAGTVRLAWSSPQGPTIYSRSVAVTAG